MVEGYGEGQFETGIIQITEARSNHFTVAPGLQCWRLPTPMTSLSTCRLL